MNNQKKINELSEEIKKLQSENDELHGHLEGYKMSYQEQCRQNKKMGKRLKNLRQYSSELHGKLLNTEEILKNTKNQNDEMIDVLLQLKESCSVVVKFEIKCVSVGRNNYVQGIKEILEFSITRGKYNEFFSNLTFCFDT